MLVKLLWKISAHICCYKVNHTIDITTNRGRKHFSGILLNIKHTKKGFK